VQAAVPATGSSLMEVHGIGPARPPPPPGFSPTPETAPRSRPQPFRVLETAVRSRVVALAGLAGPASDVHYNSY